MDNDILYEYCYPRSGPLRCLAVLVGDTPIPGKTAPAKSCPVALKQSFWSFLLIRHKKRMLWFLHPKHPDHSSYMKFLSHTSFLQPFRGCSHWQQGAFKIPTVHRNDKVSPAVFSSHILYTVLKVFPLLPKGIHDIFFRHG